MNWLDWPFASPAVAWFGVCALGSWRLYRAPLSTKNTRRFFKPPWRFQGATLLLAGVVSALPVAIFYGEWLGIRTPFSMAQWRAMTTPELPSYHPEVAAGLVLEVALQIAAFTYSFVVVASCFEKRRAFSWHFNLLAVLIVIGLGFDQIILAGMIHVHQGDREMDALRTALIVAMGVAYVNRARRPAKTFTSRKRKRSTAPT